MVKNPPVNVRDMGLIPALGRSHMLQCATEVPQSYCGILSWEKVVHEIGIKFLSFPHRGRKALGAGGSEGSAVADWAGCGGR